MTAQILHGNNLDILPTLADCSVDSVVTDPPYELGFMGKQWDATGIAYNVELWRECLRVLRPGGHLLAFGGTRTYHRMAVAIEDAGFEIRDSIHWLYGSGFPKSLDVSKAIDRQRHDREDIYKVTAWVRGARDAAGISNRDIDGAFGANGMGRHWTDVPPHGKQPAVPTLEQVPLLLDVLGLTLDDVPADIRRLLWDLNGRKGQPGENWAKREVVGTKTSGIANNDEGPRHTIGASQAVIVDITAPATDAARQWDGWGTALKPAHEPIVLARKPLVGTVADNVLRYGTGAINIDATRIQREPGDTSQAGHQTATFGTQNTTSGGDGSGGWEQNDLGRWPANIILDPDAAEELGPEARYFYCAKPSKKERNAGLENLPKRDWKSQGFRDNESTHLSPRAGAGRTSANQNFHPTVKPLALMRYLVRLVTPPNGHILDPFAGSGTTLTAATLEGHHSTGIELTDDYIPIIKARIAWAEQQTENQAPQLFST